MTLSRDRRTGSSGLGRSEIPQFWGQSVRLSGRISLASSRAGCQKTPARLLVFVAAVRRYQRCRLFRPAALDPVNSPITCSRTTLGHRRRLGLAAGPARSCLLTLKLEHLSLPSPCRPLLAQPLRRRLVTAGSMHKIPLRYIPRSLAAVSAILRVHGSQLTSPARFSLSGWLERSGRGLATCLQWSTTPFCPRRAPTKTHARRCLGLSLTQTMDIDNLWNPIFYLP